MARPPRIPVWLSQDQPVIYFVTICEAKRRSVLANEVFFNTFAAAVTKIEERGLWFVWSGVVMPDHLHVLVSPLKDRDQKIGDFSAAIKRWTRPGCSDVDWGWQSGCFDRLLRREESAQQKWEYMRQNPVRAGLVERWEDWEWSIGFRKPQNQL